MHLPNQRPTFLIGPFEVPHPCLQQVAWSRAMTALLGLNWRVGSRLTHSMSNAEGGFFRHRRDGLPGESNRAIDDHTHDTRRSGSWQSISALFGPKSVTHVSGTFLLQAQE